ncbi:hypothetical protein B0H13DRAFT_1874409 [Mycena leptocephala]|nr:hypothetical protein B0H13DRAFT_1874409 [Mycena leptocephala]
MSLVMPLMAWILFLEPGGLLNIFFTLPEDVTNWDWPPVAGFSSFDEHRNLQVRPTGPSWFNLDLFPVLNHASDAEIAKKKIFYSGATTGPFTGGACCAGVQVNGNEQPARAKCLPPHKNEPKSTRPLPRLKASQQTPPKKQPNKMANKAAKGSGKALESNAIPLRLSLPVLLILSRRPRSVPEMTKPDWPSTAVAGEGKLRAQETIDSLSNQAPQTLSSIIVDRRGQIVIAYMGKRVKKALGLKLSDDSEEAYEGRTAKYAPEDVEYAYDGVERRAYLPYAAQHCSTHLRGYPIPGRLSSPFGPRVVECPTVRLDPPDLSGAGTRLQNVVLGRAGQKRKREVTLEVTGKAEGAERRAPGIGVEPDNTYFCPVGKTWERAGAMHLVHSWHQQGAAAGDLIAPSKDMVGSSGQALQANVAYFKATREFAIIVAEYFKILFPGYYEKYKKDFDAGFWEAADPGPFPGGAVVFELQVYAHQDGLDRGPTVSVPAGYFMGGALHFPDLEAVFAFVVRFRGPPVPSELAVKHITRGGVSTVVFCPEKTAQTLAGKPANWNRDTAGRITPNASGKGQDSSVDKVDESSETDDEKEGLKRSKEKKENEDEGGRGFPTN